MDFRDIIDPRLQKSDGSWCSNFVALVKEQLQILVEIKEQLPEGIRLLDTNKGELAAFTSYAIAFPSSFLALVDTYDVLRSGLPNFLAVSLALRQCGYQPLGIRIDSGD